MKQYGRLDATGTFYFLTLYESNLTSDMRTLKRFLSDPEAHFDVEHYDESGVWIREYFDLPISRDL